MVNSGSPSAASSARFSSKHMFALDVACGLGTEIEIGGKRWVFSPLTLEDIGLIVRRQRAEGICAYEEGQRMYRDAHGKPAAEGRQRLNDINGLCFGVAHAQSGIDEESPQIKRLKIFLSLRRNHEEIRSEGDCDRFLEDEDTVNRLIDHIMVMTMGPISESKEGESESADPTIVRSSTISASQT